MADDNDPLLFAVDAARLAGLQSRTFRKYVTQGYGPPPDDPDLDRPAARRMARWRKSTIEAWKTQRIGQGHRTDLERPKEPAVQMPPGIERAVEWPGAATGHPDE